MCALKIPDKPYTIEGIMEDLRTQLEGEEGSRARDAAVARHSGGEFDAETQQLLARVSSSAKVAPRYQIRSHRRLIGKIVDPIKRFLHWGTRPYVDLLIENQERFNQTALEFLRALNSRAEALTDHQNKTNEIFRESLRRADAFEAQQERINRAFESSREKIEPFIGHQEKTNEIFREALRRADEFGKNQEKINQVFESARAKTEPFVGHQEKTNEIFREAHHRTDAFIEDQKALNKTYSKVAQEFQDRYDEERFFASIPEAKRLEMLDRLRGTFQDIWGRHHEYVEFFRNRPGQILDIGCGRGEFLHMLRTEGIESWGCEVDPLMAEMSRKRDLSIREMDALSALRSVPDASLGGVFASQVIEHFFPGDLLMFLKLSREKIAPGGVFILESLNPQTLGVLSKSYYRDLEHKQAVDPDYLAMLLELAGFADVRAQKIREFKMEEKLPELPTSEDLGITPQAHALLKEIIDRLNRRIWGAQDYYVLGEVPRSPATS